MKPKIRLGLGTPAIHAGRSQDSHTGAIMTPIYATSTYMQSSPGVHKDHEYGRTLNPTRVASERCIADLEDGMQGCAPASGAARELPDYLCWRLQPSQVDGCAFFAMLAQ